MTAPLAAGSPGDGRPGDGADRPGALDGAPAGIAVRTVGLAKTYTGPRGEVPAVRGIDLAVGYGEFFGLLGPNGAGKSTTIGMLTTLVVPTAGRAEVCGLDVTRRPVEVKRRIGMVSQNNTADSDLTVAENLEFRGRYFGLSAAAARRRAAGLLADFGLTERRGANPFELSGGQAKRLMICRALVHRPQVLFLDEPTAGLDPQTRVNVWDMLRGLQAAGQTIVLTTHYMEEAEEMCDRVAVIDHGTVLATGTVPEIRASAGADTVITVTFDGAPPPAVGTLRTRPGVSKVEVAGGQVRVFTREPHGLLGELVTSGTSAGRGITDAAQLPPSLETAFLTLTGREYRE
jgi:ABC-2 type transport system ATP-binding protein